MFLNFVVVFFFSFLVPFGMYVMSFFVSFKDFFDAKLSSYECGFDVVKKVHVGFSLVFFSIVLLFVVFELEVLIFIILIQGDFYSMLSFFLFFFYVVFSFYMEWYFGKLIWFC
uniref:NADH-ubiquinone oxidoreductase chain 3 n=1 Tax=Onchocerca flexuosa TaxID=387005 RepID=G8CRE4_9BILA|nr:NADH dehydrogenase subunit 3 [Onchocerca flexuosa]AEE11953.1 NADH dehydrogenase subunit 3 [Onchocerca flexuosa]